MKFSEQWLRKWVDIPNCSKDLVEQLTQIGLEVEGIEEGNIIDLAIPPNRGDCLSILGIARELSVVNKVPIKINSTAEVLPVTDNILPITVQDPQSCPKYLARIINNIDATVQTPAWMQKHLIEAGINSISAIVDITNYVMLELGQPMHAFDLQNINNEIIVRKAKPQEKLILLDDTQITLQREDVVIADQQQPLALAGIMGGSASGVTDSTKDLLLECAYFEPVSVRHTARRHGLATESSYRFERVVDINLQEQALARATSLLQQIVSGQPGPIITVVEHKYFPPSINISLRKARISKILSITPSNDEIYSILTKLGMECQANDLGWHVTIPAYRQDIKLEIDLIEEIARFIGYQSIPSLMPKATLNFKQHAEATLSESQIKSCLKCRGYHEVITYSFIASELATLFAPELAHLKLINPISSDMSVMRPSLWPGLVKVLQYNENRQCDRLRIFEVGLKFVFDQQQQLQQEKVLAGLCVGKVQPEHWAQEGREHDFFDIKGDIEALARMARGANFYYQPFQNPTLHPGKAAAIFKEDKYIGCLGELHPKLLKTLGVVDPILVFELNFNALVCGSITKFCCISKFPEIRRDLAIIVDQNAIVHEIEEAVKQEAGELLQDICIFDVYCGTGIVQGKKSIGLGIVLQHPTRTMVDDEIKQVMEQIMTGLKLKFNATLR